MEQSNDFSKYSKIKYRDSALEFISDDNQVDVKIGTILTELKSNGGEQYASAIEAMMHGDSSEDIGDDDQDGTGEG